MVIAGWLDLLLDLDLDLDLDHCSESAELLDVDFSAMQGLAGR